MKKIYLADDEKYIREIVTTFLENDGYEVRAFADGYSIRQAFDERIPDMSILDIMMPGVDGLSLCSYFRKKSSVPIIIISAQDTPMDRVTGITLGSDDYLTKPFHFEELEARIRSLTRRRFIQENVCLKCGHISFDTRTRKAHIDSEELSLTRKESALLEYFMLHQNRIISPEELIEHIWDGSVNSFSNSIRVHISSLRKKLRTALGYDPIQNKIGQGYILEE